MPRKNARPAQRKQREKLKRKMAAPKAKPRPAPRVGMIAHASSGLGLATFAAMILSRNQDEQSPPHTGATT